MSHRQVGGLTSRRQGLFEASVPPWPEARYAADVGASLAKTIGAEFYFPAPSESDDSFPTWAQLQA